MARMGSPRGWTTIIGRGAAAGVGRARAGWDDERLGSFLPDPGPGTPAGGGDLGEMLRRAVSGLPLFEREVYGLAARDGLDDRKIADRLGIGVSEVRRHLAAALVRIAAALDGGGGV
jgi:DNA-directed RNA polymerase specialized sigma24 family protein